MVVLIDGRENAHAQQSSANSPPAASTESSLKFNQSFHLLINNFDDLPDYGNLFSIMLEVIINIILIRKVSRIH